MQSHIKYLGILIDEVLSWNKQTDDICTELARANFKLSKLRHFVSKKHVHQYISPYFTLITFMVVWFGPTRPNVISFESSNYKNGAFGLLLTQNSLSVLVLFYLNLNC